KQHPCQNRARCNQNIYVSQEVLVLESAAVIFVSPQKEVFNCTCQTGFMGSRCEQDMDECQASPCKNEATCVNTEGSFFCRCQDGFTDTICSADEDECLKVECQNGGSCVATQEGYRCYCAPGFEAIFIMAKIIVWCPRATASPCHGVPCGNNGVCYDLWSDYFCECKIPFTGRNCTEGKTVTVFPVLVWFESSNCLLFLFFNATETYEDLVLWFNGTEYVEYVIKERFKRDYILKESMNTGKDGSADAVISIKFKTSEDGVLVFVQKQMENIMLKVCVMSHH
uniref:EGF-like domain-containing protein n=1 Tax=Gouania willdenowi TaxID=441366 RepID=A0A8C5EYX8_GOUWI